MQYAVVHSKLKLKMGFNTKNGIVVVSWLILFDLVGSTQLPNNGNDTAVNITNTNKTIGSDNNNDSLTRNGVGAISEPDFSESEKLEFDEGPKVGAEEKELLESTTSPYNSYFLQNRHKFLQSLKQFHAKVLKLDSAEIDLTVPETPWALVGTACDPQVWERLTGNYITQGDSNQAFLDRISGPYASHLTGTCLYPGSFPILQCSNTTRTCVCLQALDTPFNFLPNNGTAEVFAYPHACLAQEGSICDGDFLEDSRIKRINCVPDLECNVEIGNSDLNFRSFRLDKTKIINSNSN